MRSLKFQRNFRLLGLGVLGIAALAAACQSSERADDSEGSGPNNVGKQGQEIQAALDALPNASVRGVDPAGIPKFIVGNLGAAPRGNLREGDVQNVLTAVAPVFRAKAGSLRFRSAEVDKLGGVHYRFDQLKNGRRVIGGELTVHTRRGVAYAVNGKVRDDLAAPTDATISSQAAIAKATGLAASSAHVLGTSAKQELFYLRHDDRLQLVYSTEVTGVKADKTPVRDEVLIDAQTGQVAARFPKIHTAKNRELHDAGNTTNLPGPTVRTEGGAEASDAIINTNYDHLGRVYDMFKDDFGRDSFDNAGAKLISSVHYDVDYVNAFWDGTQMVYGDGDGVNASNLAGSLDVTGHELTHAVTERTSGLEYTGQSGGLNESNSDIFGAYVEWVRDGRGTPLNETTWTVGDDIWTPSVPGDGLRYMFDPAKDGQSLDWGPDEDGSQDVHYTSGPPNLAFYLLAAGGQHPRGKSTVQVPGIGIEKAAQVWYLANTTIWQSDSTYAEAATGTIQAATDLGYTADEIDAVTKAWQAIGVGGTTPPPTDGGTDAGPGDDGGTDPGGVLANGAAVTGISGAKGDEKVYTLNVTAGATALKFVTSGGSGDADLYVKFGSAPTTSDYKCRSWSDTTNEECDISSAQAGTYYVMVKGYSSFSGVSLTGSYTE